ncbi:MAG: flagellar biosynthesis protein FliQ [Planctomycetota bacterium]
MPFDQAIQLVRETLTLMLFLSAPILLVALAVGLVISVIQAATQLQEQTLSFVPKILGMGVIAVLTAPWMFAKIMDFSARMFGGF